jgi:hypothetical protein
MGRRNESCPAACCSAWFDRLAFTSEPERVPLHGRADRQRNGHLTLLMLDDLKLRDKKLHELLTGSTFGSNRAPVKPMPLAEVPQDVIRMRVRHLAEFVGVRAEFADDGLPSPATSAEPSAKTAGLRENWVRFYDPDTGLHEARISYPCELR